MRKRHQGGCSSIQMDASRRLAGRGRLLLWGVLFLALGGSVFTWGLQYKLSLYDAPDAPSHAMPAAKLLSQDERPNVAEKVLLTKPAAAAAVTRAALSFQLYLLFVLSTGLCPKIVRWTARWRSQRPTVLFRTGLTAFFFRPPPVLS